MNQNSENETLRRREKTINVTSTPLFNSPKNEVYPPLTLRYSLVVQASLVCKTSHKEAQKTNTKKKSPKP